MAPTTSSIFNENKSFVAKYIIAPPTAPITIDKNGLGAKGSAVIATKPAIAPFNIKITSVLPPINLDNKAAVITPPQAAKFVLMKIVATEVMSSNVPAANCEPPLNPNQPIQSINTPSVAKGTDDAANGSKGLTSPFAPNLPVLGPRTMTPAKAAAPPAA